MIKSNELRVGNIVQSANKERQMKPFIIFSVVHQVRMNRGINGVNHQDVIPAMGEAFQIAEWSFEAIDPVPITTEWLKKMGFEQYFDKGGYWKEFENPQFGLEILLGKDGFYPCYCQAAELSCDTMQVVNLRRILYVHEVQNLYFALVGEEIFKGEDE